MSKKFTYYYGPLEAPLKARITVGTGKGQCAAGEGKCEEHPTKEQWRARQLDSGIQTLHFDIVEKASDNAITLEEYNQEGFNKYFNGWKLELRILDENTGDVKEIRLYENIRTRREAEEIVLTFPQPKGIIVDAWLTNASGTFFVYDPFHYKKSFLYGDKRNEYFLRSMNTKQSKAPRIHVSPPLDAE